MGFFSWKTANTKRSIANTYSPQPTFPVLMVTETEHYEESDYEGYGVFGGKDYYEALAEMNGITEGTTEEKRSKGISLYYHSKKPIKYPQLLELIGTSQELEVDFYQRPENCEYQGYFYEGIEL